MALPAALDRHRLALVHMVQRADEDDLLALLADPGQHRERPVGRAPAHGLDLDAQCALFGVERLHAFEGSARPGGDARICAGRWALHWTWRTSRSTATVRVGRYELAIGAPAGTLIVSRAGDDDPAALARALREKPAQRGAIDRAESAEEAAARTADGLDLLTDILKGIVLEPERAVKHVDLLLELMQRLDDEGRLADALRVARAVNGALALTLRWVQLVRSLRSALHAAEKLGDKPAIAWAITSSARCTSRPTTPPAPSATSRRQGRSGSCSATRRASPRPSTTSATCAASCATCSGTTACLRAAGAAGEQSSWPR